MNFQFRPAVRQDTKPLIGLYGQSGSGKTYSALLLARGLVGPTGKIALIDTESGRGSLYADQIPGGYDVLQLEEPFSPERYIAAIDAAQKHADAVIIDSISHEWEGIGGVISMAGEIEQRTGKKGLHCWNKPKREHQHLVLKLLQSRVPVIVCMRAKYKSRQVKGRNGKDEIVKDDHTSPIQADDFIFEMTAHAEILQDHTINLTKCSHPDLRLCFPDRGMLSIKTGEAIANWAAGEVQGRQMAEVLADARRAAQGGKDSLQAWWKDAPQDERSHAQTIMTELKKTAVEADAPMGGQDDNLFGDRPSEQQDDNPPSQQEVNDAYNKIVKCRDLQAFRRTRQSFASLFDRMPEDERQKLEDELNDAQAILEGGNTGDE